MVPCREVPAHARPLVIGELRFSDDRKLVLHTLSFDRAIHGVRLLGPRLGPAAVPVRARVPAAPPGRNDPCPCGSGRKYKRCCLGQAGTPPAGR